MAIALGQIRDLLLPGLMEITGEYDQISTQWKSVFATKKSNMALERSASVAFMPLAQVKSEGGATAFSNSAGERYIYNMEPIEVGLAYAITRKAIADNLYKAAFKPTNLGLQKSFADFWEIEGASVFNTANVYVTALGGDGQPLLSTAHPVDGNTVANTPSIALDLNEASLLASQTAIRRNFLNEAGLKIKARAQQLLVPPELEAVAGRLCRTELRPGTANNDVNMIPVLSGGLPKGYSVMDYFTSPYAWFLKTDIEGLIYLDREPFETDMQVDFVTDNLLVKGYQRGGFFYNDWRSVYGSMPTS
jgi:hypothetical protein